MSFSVEVVTFLNALKLADYNQSFDVKVCFSRSGGGGGTIMYVRKVEGIIRFSWCHGYDIWRVNAMPVCMPSFELLLDEDAVKI